MSTLLAAPVGPGVGGVENPALGTTLRGFLAPGGGGGSVFFSRLISASISFILVGGVIASFFYLLLGAFEYITSGGDKQAVQGAQGKIKNSVIGLILMFSAFAIIRLLETFLGITIMSIDITQFFIQ